MDRLCGAGIGSSAFPVRKFAKETLNWCETAACSAVLYLGYTKASFSSGFFPFFFGLSISILAQKLGLDWIHDLLERMKILVYS